MSGLHKGFHADKETISEIADHIRKYVKDVPTVGIICGSGLGKLADGVKNPIVLRYEDIPHFPHSTVEGHHGNLVFGKLGNKYVVVMQGRFHFYEGYSNNEILIPIRVMKVLGVQSLLISNASGGLNNSYKLGDLVIIKDHISFPGLSLNNILVGHNDSSFGERFVATSDAYSSRLRKLFKTIADEAGHSKIVREGVYAHVGGPTYETPAECRMLVILGSDVVGMSTAPEVVAARHAGMEVFAISLVTNICVQDQESNERACHQEVLDTAAMRTETLQQLITQMVSRM